MQLLKWRTRAPLLALLFLSVAGASQAGSPIRSAPGVQVLLPEEVMAAHTRTDASGQLYLREAEGSWIRLITKVDDPEIQNQGDGQFHAARAVDVVSSLEAIPPSFLGGLEVVIYVLPFPRAGRVTSSAAEGAIYLSPGVREYEARHVHFLLAHEIGHVIHRKYLPDADQGGWDSYRSLRGISREDLFHEDAPHAYRPHEIFAEDFRVLFGGSLASGDGSIENSELPVPGALPRLADFYRRLVGSVALPLEALRLVPNPCRGASSLTLVGAAMDEGSLMDVRATLLDLSGRRLRVIPTRPGARGTFTLELSADRELPAGAYWVRIDSDRSSEVVPLRILR